MNTGWSYVFQAVVLLQPLFWMWLYDSLVWFRENALKEFFYTQGVLWAFVLWKYQFSVGFFTTSIIIQYIIYTMLSVYIFSQRKNFKEALSLGFLTVWLNSFYWEAPLHLAEVLSSGFHVGMLIQAWRLAPVPFMLKHFKFTKMDRATLSLGLLCSVAVMYMRQFLHIHWIWLHPLNRLICLLLLTKVIVEAEVKIEV